MRLFKNFKDYVFTQLFPRYFKDNDTYKDRSGKGILERFIDVCSEYLDVSLVPNIDNATDNLDVDKASAIYLNYIWELFGEIPYAYGVVVGDTEYSEENLKRWLEKGKNTFPRANPREVLGYAISLYKIRGTRLFFEVLARFYGWDIKIDEVPYGYDGNYEYEQVGHSSNHIIVQCYINPNRPIRDRLVAEIFPDRDQGGAHQSPFWDDTRMGWGYTDCGLCSRLRFSIFIDRDDYKYLINKDETGEYFDKVKQLMADIFNRYLPIQVEMLDAKGGKNFFVYPKSNAELIPEDKTDGVNYNTQDTKIWVDDFITNLE